MKKIQLTQILADINDTSYIYNSWFKPSKFAYVVLKDNSLLYIGERDMWYLDGTDELLYVASALKNDTTGDLQMPTTGITNQNNIDRVIVIVDFENINHMVLQHQGQYLGGER